MFRKSIEYLGGFVFWLAALVPPAADAYTVVGRVTNGTSGRADVVVDVEVVNPRGGMQVERALRTEDGTFAIDNLSDTSHVYVIRTVYLGVSYPDIIRYEGFDTTFHEVTVYDTTSSTRDLDVSIPHMMIRRSGEHFRFETIYEVVNRTDPPMTIVDKPFKLFMPDDRVSVNALYTTELGLPINKDAIATADKEIYRIDAPLKPGPTRLALSFDVHAHDGTYAYEQTLPYDIESITVIVEDPAIVLSEESTALQKSESDRGGMIYGASSLAASSRFAFRVSGGSAEAETSPSENRRIITQSQAGESGSIPVILILTLLLLALPVLGLRKPAAERTLPETIESRKNRLFGQIARLDDLHAAGTVEETLYRAKRAELKSRVAALMRQTGAAGTEPPRKAKNPKRNPK